MTHTYFTANDVLSMVAEHLRLDPETMICQWQVDKDGAFDGIIIHRLHHIEPAKRERSAEP